jgi:hypothetical protein
MAGILADTNVEGHWEEILNLLLSDTWRDVWLSLNLELVTFESLGLPRDAPDSLVWQTCQDQHITLITGNRNDEGPDSLQAVIRTKTTPASLPVITLANPPRILRSKPYARRVAEKLLEYLLYIDEYHGAGGGGRWKLCIALDAYARKTEPNWQAGGDIPRSGPGKGCCRNAGLGIPARPKLPTIVRVPIE